MDPRGRLPRDDMELDLSFSFGAGPAEPTTLLPFFSVENNKLFVPKTSLKNDPVWMKIIASLPVLVAFPTMMLSAQLSLPVLTSAFSVFQTVQRIFTTLLLSSGFLLVARVLAKVKVVAIPSSSSSPNLTVLLIVVLAVAALPLLAFTASRVSTVYFGLFLNIWNPYSAIVMLLDLWGARESFLLIFVVVLGYGAMVVLFKTINTLLLTDAPAKLAQLDVRVLAATAGVSAVAVVLFQLASPVMVAVNLAAGCVLLISLADSHLRFSSVNAMIVAAFALSLEFVVLSPPVSASMLVAVVATAAITPDKKVTAFSETVTTDETHSSLLKDLLSHSDTRAIFNFLLLNSTFMMVQLLYSFRSKSLGLLSDSLHMALDCSSLALGLVAGHLSKHPIDSNGKYPFGLKLFEILAGFTNGTLLIGISGSIIFEAIGRLFNPVSLQKTNELIIVSILGLLVNLVGIFAFNHGHDGHDHGHSHGHSHSHSHSHSHGHGHAEAEHCDEGMNDNMKGIFLHILADTLGSVGVVISTVLIKFFHWEGFDPVASIIIAVLIFGSAVPLIKSSASTLLLRLNTDKESKLRSALNEITTIKGLKSFTTPRFWPSTGLNLTGYIHVQVYRGENDTFIKRQCHSIFNAHGIEAMIQVENDFDPCWCREDPYTQVK